MKSLVYLVMSFNLNDNNDESRPECNERDIYESLQWLAACVNKRRERGQAIDPAHLAGCSTMAKIVSAGVKAAKRDTWVHVTHAERVEVARRLADIIIYEMAN